MASCFSLLVMLFTVPLPGGTTGHITGSPLVAIFLGPWAATLAVSVALAIQAVLFGDGGITALGADCSQSRFAESFVAYEIYRIITAAGSKVSAWRSSSLSTAKPLCHSLSKLPARQPAPLIALNVRPSHSPGTGPAAPPAQRLGSRCLFPFFFQRDPPCAGPGSPSDRSGRIGRDDYGGRSDLSSEDSTRNTKGVQIRVVLRLVVLLFLPIAGEAHDFWIERKGGEFTVVFGHGTQREEYDSSRIKQVKAFDTNGKPISVSHEKKGKRGLSRTVRASCTHSCRNRQWVLVQDPLWLEEPSEKKGQPRRRGKPIFELFQSPPFVERRRPKILRRCGS